jgi:YD repeat-containing protein
LLYDANGNLISQTDGSGITTFTWDVRNRLVAVVGPGTSPNFGYDVIGRRISKTINGKKTEYHYDKNDIVTEKVDGAVQATYLRSLDIDEHFVRQSHTNKYYHADVLGSTLALSDSTSFVTTRRLTPVGVELLCLWRLSIHKRPFIIPPSYTLFRRWPNLAFLVRK